VDPINILGIQWRIRCKNETAEEHFNAISKHLNDAFDTLVLVNLILITS